MADVSCCTGTECPKKNVCYRHTAPTNDFWQSYFVEAPLDKDTKVCAYFWPVNTTKEKSE